MNHLHFVQSVEPLYGAGLGYAAVDLNAALTREGENSELITTRDQSFDRKTAGVSQYVRSGPQKLFFSRRLAKEARDLVKANDYIHGHGFYVYPNLVFGREARRQQKPLIYHPHGFLDPWILGRSRIKKQIARWLFEDANTKHAAFWRALSKKEEKQIRDYGVTAPIVTLPNGVHLPPERANEEVEKLRDRFPKKRPRRLLFLSRIHKKKGLDLLIQAWAGLSKDLTSDWEIAIFGPDENGYQAEVEEMTRQASLTDAITFYGSVSGEDKEAALRSSDLFVLPSYSEGFPMAVLEAASYSLPVVQTNECNFPELTEHGGAWESSPTADSLRLVLHEALSAGEDELRQRGQAGLELVARDYSWSSVAAGLVKACEQFC